MLSPRLPGPECGTEVRTGGYDETALDGCALVCASPGVPWDDPLLDAARARGIPVTSEIDLFLRRCPGEILGVTGTNGKTTTTAMLGAILGQGDRPVLVGGNIGETVLDRLPEITPNTWWCSSCPASSSSRRATLAAASAWCST